MTDDDTNLKQRVNTISFKNSSELIRVDKLNMYAYTSNRFCYEISATQACLSIWNISVWLKSVL